jgi:hypothetical protein
VSRPAGKTAEDERLGRVFPVGFSDPADARDRAVCCTDAFGSLGGRGAVHLGPLACRRDDDPLVAEHGPGAASDPRAREELLREPDPAAPGDDQRLAVASLRLLADAPVADADRPVRDSRRLDVVAHDDCRAPVLAREFPDQLVHESRAASIQLTRRLVREEESRAVRKRGADGDALLLPAGELRRAGVPLVGEADPLQKLVGPAQAPFLRRACEPGLNADELPRGQLWVQ